MKTKLLLSVLSIVLVAGCVGIDLGDLGGVTSAVGGGNGLEMTSFTAEPSPLFSGSSLRLIMEVENRGGTTVNNSEAMIYLTGSNFANWNCDQSTSTASYLFDSLGRDMKAEDIVRGIPADIVRKTWTCNAPTVAAGQTRQDTFIGRVYHEYSTSANGNVWVYTENEADAARTAGRQLYTPSFTYTKGPVGLQVSVTPNPIIVYGSDKTFTLYVKISNLASGTIYYPKSVTYTGTRDVNLTREEINNVSVTIGNVSGLNVGSGCTGPQELVAGRETTLVCTVNVTGNVDTFVSYNLPVTVEYGYYTERTATVTVQGK